MAAKLEPGGPQSLAPKRLVMDLEKHRVSESESATASEHAPESRSHAQVPSDPPAEPLLARWKEGYESLGRLLVRYRDEVVAAVRRKGFRGEDPDDAVQGFTEKVLRAGKPPDRDFRRWFLRGAMNMAVDQGRRALSGRRRLKGAAPSLVAGDNSSTLDESTHSDRTRERAEALEEVKKLCVDAVLDLPEDKQKELIGRAVNMSYAEIAEWVEKTTTAVGVDLHRTMARLRQILGERVLQLWKAREA